jgi:hypothetical protein
MANGDKATQAKTLTNNAKAKCKVGNIIDWQKYEQLATVCSANYRKTVATLPTGEPIRHTMADMQAEYFDCLANKPNKTVYLNELKKRFGKDVYSVSLLDMNRSIKILLDRDEFDKIIKTTRLSCSGPLPSYFFVFVSLNAKGMIVTIGSSHFSKEYAGDLFIPSGKMNGTDYVICYHLADDKTEIGALKEMTAKEYLRGASGNNMVAKLDKITGWDWRAEADKFVTDVIIIPVDVSKLECPFDVCNSKNARKCAATKAALAMEKKVNYFLIFDKGYPVLNYYSVSLLV